MPILDRMDEGVVDEVGPVDVVEGAHLRSKDHDTAKPPESSARLESHETIVLGEGDYPESSFNVFADFLEDKNVNRNGSTAEPSEQPCASPRYMDDAGNMVEELMVRDYDGSNLAIVGTSNNREKIQTKLSNWPNLYRFKSGSGTGSSHSNNLYPDNSKQKSSIWDDARYSSFPDVLDKISGDDLNKVTGQLTSTGHNQEPNMSSHGGIQTKIISKSGFSEFFIKSTLKGKGIVFRGPPLDDVRFESSDTNNGKGAAGNIIGSSPLQSLSVDTAMPSSVGLARPGAGGSVHEGVSLREWLKTGRHKINKVECLHIFRQIVDVVDCSHSQGTPLRNLRPSCFKLSQMNQIKYLGPAVQRGMLEDTKVHGIAFPGDPAKRRQPVEQGMFPHSGTYPKKQKFSINMSSARRWPQFTPNYLFESETQNYGDINIVDTQEFCINQHKQSAEFGTQRNLSSHQMANAAQHQLTSISDQLEEKWYVSPEEQNDDICTVSSNIYSLGVLLFELLGRFETERAHATAMLELRQRILPPHFLSENPKEAGFCLWLLHPEPSSRPTAREILQSEVINGLHEVSAEEQSLSIDQDDAESELLLHFLVSLKEHEQKDAAKLVEEIRLLDADIGEIESRNLSRNHLHHVTTDLDAGKFSVQHKVPSSLELHPHFSFSCNANQMRFMSNIKQLESAYFSMRSRIHLPGTDATKRQDKDVLRNRVNWNLTSETEEDQKPTDCTGAFFNGLCKYAWCSKFEVRGLMRTGDFSNSANVICSLSFDRDADYFAAAGVSKKIKVFEFNALFNDSVDIHYPVIEMPNKSRLSCVCWNNYVKNYLASTDYDGVVKLWDLSTGQGIFQYSEHEKRAWSVDFSQVYPTKLASGSDDCSVKLWSINEKKSLGTIRSIANVCCVQFSSHSSHFLAFGSADWRTYCYDLRNVRTPWCVLAGHEKTVSYVKFVDPETLVTASTDNTLKIWNLNKTSSSGLSTAACSLTLGGHTNKKNFVGLSVADGYIACGSETNEVYAYNKSLPMPITSHKFGSIDPISGKETDDDDGQFVSSVCWRGKSDMIIAANSSGCIKVLQMT